MNECQIVKKLMPNNLKFNLMLFYPALNSEFIDSIELTISLLEEALVGLKAARENFIHDNDALISKIEEALKE